jgi:hypothetical protein
VLAAWPGPEGAEYAFAIDRRRSCRLLVLPALFDEANKLRHFTVETLRRLDDMGIDTMLPDLPGCNESPARLETQSLGQWRAAAALAAAHFEATHVLAIRGGALCEPPGQPTVRYAPVTGAAVLRALLRARVLASKEAGVPETREALLEQGRRAGIELAGYPLGPRLVSELETAEPGGGAALANIGQADLGGPGLWLRAEPDHSAEQATALASLVMQALVR